MPLTQANASPPASSHICPWWIGWALVSPVRRWLFDPERVVRPLAGAARRVLEVGPGYGFFTLPLLRALSPDAKVHCVDLQPGMLAGLRRRLRRAGLLDRVELRLASSTDLGTDDLAGTIDLALLLYVLHEVPDAARLVRQVVATLGSHGRVLLLEPKGHCTPALFAHESELLREQGLVQLELPADFSAGGKQVVLFGRR